MKCGHKFKEKECQGDLVLIPENFPWSEEHYQCEECYSTYLKFVIEDRIIEDRDNKITLVLATASNGNEA